MKRWNKVLKVAEIYICDCGFEFLIYRPVCLRRKKGHLKSIWCPRCKERKNFKCAGIY